MPSYLPLNINTNNDFRAGKSGTANNNFTASASKSYIFVYMKDGSADSGSDNATIGYDPTNVSATINSSGGSGTAWSHSTTSFNGNSGGGSALSHESDTTYNWGETSNIGSTGISLSGLRTKYINSALIGAADNSGLKSGTANTKFSDFRGSKLLFDGSDVPTGSTAAISIGSVFRNKRFAISSKVGLDGDGEHSSYSYLKLTFNSSGGSEIYWSVSSEEGYDFLYVYVEEAASSGFEFTFSLTDSAGDGWDNAELYIRNSSDVYLKITPGENGAAASSSSTAGGTNGITLASGQAGGSSTTHGTISLTAADYKITVTEGDYPSEIAWLVRDHADSTVSFDSNGAGAAFNLRVDSQGGGAKIATTATAEYHIYLHDVGGNGTPSGQGIRIKLGSTVQTLADLSGAYPVDISSNVGRLNNVSNNYGYMPSNSANAPVFKCTLTYSTASQATTVFTIEATGNPEFLWGIGAKDQNGLTFQNDSGDTKGDTGHENTLFQEDSHDFWTQSGQYDTITLTLDENGDGTIGVAAS